MKLRLALEGEVLEVTVERREDGSEVSFGGSRFRIESLDRGLPSGAFVVNGRPMRILWRREGPVLRIALGGEAYEVSLVDRAAAGRAAHGTKDPETRSPMPGKVLQVSVSPGDRVEPGDPLLVLEAMKMENVLAADVRGEVAEIHVGVGDMVEPGKLLIVVRPDTE